MSTPTHSLQHEAPVLFLHLCQFDNSEKTQTERCKSSTLVLFLSLENLMTSQSVGKHSDSLERQKGCYRHGTYDLYTLLHHCFSTHSRKTETLNSLASCHRSVFAWTAPLSEHHSVSNSRVSLTLSTSNDWNLSHTLFH